MKESPIILFDGVCNACTWSVRFIIERDPQGVFKFAPLQSSVGRELIRAHGLRLDTTDSVILVDGDRVLTKSDAVLQIATQLSGVWPALTLLRIIPRPLRDWGYDVLAANRYRWFGKQKTCMILPPRYSKRILDGPNRGGDET